MSTTIATVSPNAPKTPIRTVRVADNLWRAAHDKARREGRSLSDVIRDALERYVADD